MNTRPARVPNVKTAERRAVRLQREAVIAEQMAFLESFDRQVTELDAGEDKEEQ
ncbi:hypothetical protein [Devosia sp. A449]